MYELAVPFALTSSLMGFGGLKMSGVLGASHLMTAKGVGAVAGGAKMFGGGTAGTLAAIKTSNAGKAGSLLANNGAVSKTAALKEVLSGTTGSSAQGISGAADALGTGITSTGSLGGAGTSALATKSIGGVHAGGAILTAKKGAISSFKEVLGGSSSTGATGGTGGAVAGGTGGAVAGSGSSGAGTAATLATKAIGGANGTGTILAVQKGGAVASGTSAGAVAATPSIGATSPAITAASGTPVAPAAATSSILFPGSTFVLDDFGITWNVTSALMYLPGISWMYSLGGKNDIAQDGEYDIDECGAKGNDSTVAKQSGMVTDEDSIPVEIVLAPPASPIPTEYAHGVNKPNEYLSPSGLVFQALYDILISDRDAIAHSNVAVAAH